MPCGVGSSRLFDRGLSLDSSQMMRFLSYSTGVCLLIPPKINDENCCLFDRSLSLDFSPKSRGLQLIQQGLSIDSFRMKIFLAYLTDVCLLNHIKCHNNYEDNWDSGLSIRRSPAQI